MPKGFHHLHWSKFHDNDNDNDQEFYHLYFHYQNFHHYYAIHKHHYERYR